MVELQQEIESTEQGWPAFARSGTQRAIDRATGALVESSPSLDWAFDSAGVVGSSIRLSHLQEVTKVLGQSLRGLGRDELLYHPQPMVPGTTVHQLVDPFVASTFPSSFGVRLVAPPVPEQLSIDGTVFERSADRLVGLFQDAETGGPDIEITELLDGLRSTTLNGLRMLAELIADGGSAAKVRWRDQAVLRISPAAAERVASAIRYAEPYEEVRTIRGELHGGDLDGRFHINVLMSSGQVEKTYSGGVEPTIREVLRGTPLGARVIAELTVTVLDSPFADEPRETFVLTSLRRA